MSDAHVGAVFGLEVTRSQREVLIALAHHAHRRDGDGAKPSIGRISWMTDLGERQVKRVLKDLRDAGLIEVSAEARQHTPTTYRLTLDQGTEKQPFVDSRGDIRKSPLSEIPRGDISTSRGDISAPRGDIQDVTRTYEHMNKRSREKTARERSPADVVNEHTERERERSRRYATEVKAIAA